jgi:hypothetical protein
MGHKPTDHLASCPLAAVSAAWKTALYVGDAVAEASESPGSDVSSLCRSIRSDMNGDHEGLGASPRIRGLARHKRTEPIPPCLT